VVFLCASVTARAMDGPSFWHRKAARDGQPQAKPAVTSSQPPAFSIPVEPLGFFAPAAFYEGQRESLVSLDFLDENRLLFTFRTPGLIRRAGAPEQDERQIRAVVLALPKGTVETEALWTLHDRARYLWMLDDGHFLLRDRDNLEQGDGSLELKPLLHFPGPLQWLEMDPAQEFLVTDSQEPLGGAQRPGDVPGPATAEASISEDKQGGAEQADIVLRILHRASGQVMLVSRVRTTVHLPVNSDGYIEALRGNGRDWILNLNFFSGGSKILGKVESDCSPALQFISQQEALATTCDAAGGRLVVAVSTDGRRLWQASSPPTQVWPILVMAPDGSRVARETLTVDQPVNAFSPLSFDDVKGQLVEVYDAAAGKLELKAPASPVLDGGGNVAISPSGKRVAVLDGGAIQVYELPAPAPQAKPDAGHSTH
jgi:hypothetical protein